MSNLPVPIRVALGLAATAVEEARKLPETLPQAGMNAVASAMQASLKLQQQLAALTARGDEVIGRWQGVPDEPPAWATFDDDEPGSGPAATAAFDRVASGTGTAKAATREAPTAHPEPTVPKKATNAKAPTAKNPTAKNPTAKDPVAPRKRAPKKPPAIDPTQLDE